MTLHFDVRRESARVVAGRNAPVGLATIGALFVFAVLGVLAAGCTSPEAALCAGVTGTCKGIPAGSTETVVQTAFVEVADGGTIVFGTGTFNFTNGLSLATSNVTVKGQGIDTTILDFSNQEQSGSAVGIYSNHDGFTLEDLSVKDPFGDAVKIEGATGVTVQRVHTYWTGDDPTLHGAYGIYPVQCTDVLIQDSHAEGASDTGIYVGQSNNIVIRRNEVDTNVAGIEIENSHSADVYSNNSHDNSGGILVFALPGLQMHDTKNVRVYMNTVTTNNTKNFAPAGNIVGKVPSGMGFIIMAADSVEVFGNTVTGNKTAQAGIVSYLVVDSMYTDPNLYPYPTSVWFHDNTFTGGGDKPDQSNQLGIALAHTMFADKIVPTMVYDGILDPQRMVTSHPGNSMDICQSNNGSATFSNLHADMMDSGSVSFDHFSADSTPYDCTLTALPAVSFAGLN